MPYPHVRPLSHPYRHPPSHQASPATVLITPPPDLPNTKGFSMIDHIRTTLKSKPRSHLRIHWIRTLSWFLRKDSVQHSFSVSFSDRIRKSHTHLLVCLDLLASLPLLYRTICIGTRACNLSLIFEIVLTPWVEEATNSHHRAYSALASTHPRSIFLPSVPIAFAAAESFRSETKDQA
jgi:hypothetical protein